MFSPVTIASAIVPVSQILVYPLKGCTYRVTLSSCYDLTYEDVKILGKNLMDRLSCPSDFEVDPKMSPAENGERLAKHLVEVAERRLRLAKSFGYFVEVEERIAARHHLLATKVSTVEVDEGDPECDCRDFLCS